MVVKILSYVNCSKTKIVKAALESFRRFLKIPQVILGSYQTRAKTVQ
ncbi:hypothetical protein TREPR_1187 [Treponema primitia ZAS-2]|uniref:Uncharacterized protein n=1 Tax=Treponema primitia (strain ATCC BAA-887 / DSM 12427 / ZAS-2) TaxID=545694 RepID=F5YGU1_TREPZ|nr:hypothetical protein TREPR_1187 [Treponema primitia ZAS-2]